MRTTFGLAAALVLVAAPVVAQPTIHRTPFVPADVLTTPPDEGTVMLTYSVRMDGRWATESIIVVPEEQVVPVECSVPMRTEPLG